MYRLKFLLLFLTVSFLYNYLPAQDKLNIKFGKIKPEDFDVKSPLIDSSTNAVVVADVGKSTFTANTTELTFSLQFIHKKRIKLLNKNGFDAATITIPLYVFNNKEERLEDLDAYTYNLENGKVVETKVTKANIFSEKHSENLIYKKFTFPAIKEGSIIEYSYQVKSDFYFNLQPWVFQGEYPVLWSQYEAAIPEFYKYATISQGYQPFFINKVNASQVSFSFVEHVEREPSGGMLSGRSTSGMNNFKVDGAIDFHTWVMKDVPALKEEAYTTTLRNAIAKMEFQLYEVAFPNMPPKNYMDNWEKVASDLMKDDDFGGWITRPNNWLDDDLAAIVKNTASKKEMAEKIYGFIRDNFTWNDNYGIYLTKGLKEVWKNKSGSVAEINMLLIAMLRNQEINANPIILSTRGNGVTNEYYPLLNRYNYVIAKVLIDDKITYLDATVPQLHFGILPTYVYNGHSREINNNTALPVFLLADSIKEVTRTFVYIGNMDKGAIEGTYVHNYGLFESQHIRNKMTKTMVAEMEKSLRQEFPEEIQIANVAFDSLKLLNQPVALKCDMMFKLFNEEDIVYFNPMMNEAIRKNPFVAAQRYYPVEMPYTIDELFALTMEIPKGYKVEELPKSVRFNFNEDEGMFEYIISTDKGFIQMRCRLLLHKANYLNEDYQSLREFYTYIVKKESEQIVFKKIK